MNVRFRQDLDLMPEIQSATHRDPSRFAVMLLVVVALFFATFLGWANFATIDEVTRGEGRVISSRQNQIVQNLEGGIVADILVREGAIVEQGQPLLKIDNTTAQADYQDNRAKYIGLMAMAARLQAEAEGKETFDVPPEVQAEAPDVGQAELALFRSRQANLNSEVEILEAQLDQRSSEIKELNSTVRRLQNQYDSLMQELRMTEPLVRQGAMSRVELIRLERQAQDTRGQLETSRLAIPRAESAILEAQQKITDKRLAYRSEARLQLNKARADMSVIEGSMLAGQDRVRRTEVRSPVHGTIKRLHVATIGGVVRPGADLVEIVPLEDTLLVEAKIRPSDVAFIRPGQTAMVKITAYDFSIYGGLEAKVEDISADTIKDEERREESFYRIRVRTDANHLVKNGEVLPIIPGMTAGVDILTGQKTVLHYLLKPILKAKGEALRER